MIDWILASSVLIIAVFLIRKLFGEKLTAGVQYGLWLLVLLRLVIPVNFFQSGYSLPELMEKAVKSVRDAEEEEMYIAPEGDAGYMPGEASEGDAEHLLGEEAETDVGNIFDEMPEGDVGYMSGEEAGGDAEYSSVFYVIWMIGMAVTGGIFLLTNLFFRVRIYSDRMEIEEEELKKRKLFSEVPVYITKFVATPCLAGLKSPAVYLPGQIWEDSTEGKNHAEGKGKTKKTENNKVLRAMVCHENVHYRHGDQLWGMFRLFCLILHWYNPFVWAAALASRQDAELACDAGAVRRLGEENRFDYGRILLHMTAQEGHFGGLSDELRHAGFCNTEMSDTKRHMERRIKRLAAAQGKNRMALAAAFTLGFIAFVWLFGGKVGQDSLFWKIAGDDSEAETVRVTELPSEEEKAAAEDFYPGEEEVEEVRKTALAGMSEEEISALTGYVKTYHNWLEWNLLYDNWERTLSNKESVEWNFVDQTGEVVAGWHLEEDLNGYGDIEGEEERREYLREKYPEFGKVSLEELGKKYGEPYYRESWYGAETVIQRMRELTASAENEVFRSDVEALCSALQQAKDTHEVAYVMQAHEIVHDMEYFLLRYSPRDVAPYTQDKSLSGRYYGVLEVWEAWREGRL